MDKPLRRTPAVRGFAQLNRGDFEGLEYGLFLARTEEELEYFADEIVGSMGTAWGARDYLIKIFEAARYEPSLTIGDAYDFPESILQMTASEFFTLERAKNYAVSKNIITRLRIRLSDSYYYARAIRRDPDKKDPLLVREIVMAN
jgi:hypothetical protein